jgi:hypothetical protein
VFRVFCEGKGDSLRKYILLGLILVFFLIMPTSVAYTAGDVIEMRLPSSGTGYALLKPKFYRYTLFDPDGIVVYEEDHDLVYLHQDNMLLWRFYDTYAIKIPSFPKEGKWKLSGRLFGEALIIIDIPDPFTTDKYFDVESSGLIDSLLAPWYFTLDAGPTGGRFSGGLPFHWILIVIAIIVIFIVLHMLVLGRHALLRRSKG